MSVYVLPPASKTQPTYLSWRRRSRRDKSAVKIIQFRNPERTMAFFGGEMQGLSTWTYQQRHQYGARLVAAEYINLSDLHSFFPLHRHIFPLVHQKVSASVLCPGGLWHQSHRPSSNRPSFQQTRFATRKRHECGEELSKSHFRAYHGYQS